MAVSLHDVTLAFSNFWLDVVCQHYWRATKKTSHTLSRWHWTISIDAFLLKIAELLLICIFLVCHAFFGFEIFWAKADDNCESTNILTCRTHYSYRRISYDFSVDVLRLPRIFTMYVGHLLLRIRRHVLFKSSICCWRQWGRDFLYDWAPLLQRQGTFPEIGICHANGCAVD